MSQKKFKRRRKLIKPQLQLKLTLTFVGLSALSLLLQFVLFQSTLTTAAVALPNDSIVLLEASTSILLQDLLVCFLVFLPLTFAVGVLVTFRIAGPVYRFETFLKSVSTGGRPPNFTLRKGDELQDLAKLLNIATEPLRIEETPEREEVSAAPEAGEPEPLLPATQEGRARHE